MSEMSRDLGQCVFLVTGASRGIGRALALDLVERGAIVYALARDVSSLPVIERLHRVGADVRDDAALANLATRIESSHGRLDGLINNASILGPKGPLESLDLDGWKQAMQINVDGTFIVTRAMIPLLRAAERPLAIFLSSSVGRAGRANWGAYSVSKFGAEALSEILAQELAGDGAVVVSLNPGGTATDMRAEAYPGEDPATLPTAEAVAATIVLLVEKLGGDQNGAKYSSRALFDFVGRDAVTADELPRDA